MTGPPGRCCGPDRVAAHARRLLRLPWWKRPCPFVGSSVHGCWLGTYEYEKQALFTRTITRKSTVFDIGSNVGFYTLLASTLVGPDGKVFAFEPLPRNLSYLRKHLELNKANNVIVIDAAISENNGFTFFDASVRGEMAHIASSGQFQVRTYTLDHLLELGQIPIPDFIKMDIEGAEFSALLGIEVLVIQSTSYNLSGNTWGYCPS